MDFLSNFQININLKVMMDCTKRIMFMLPEDDTGFQQRLDDIITTWDYELNAKVHTMEQTTPKAPQLERLPRKSNDNQTLPSTKKQKFEENGEPINEPTPPPAPAAGQAEVEETMVAVKLKEAKSTQTEQNLAPISTSITEQSHDLVLANDSILTISSTVSDNSVDSDDGTDEEDESNGIILLSSDEDEDEEYGSFESEIDNNVSSSRSQNTNDSLNSQDIEKLSNFFNNIPSPDRIERSNKDNNKFVPDTNEIVSKTQENLTLAIGKRVPTPNINTDSSLVKMGPQVQATRNNGDSVCTVADDIQVEKPDFTENEPQSEHQPTSLSPLPQRLSYVSELIRIEMVDIMNELFGEQPTPHINDGLESTQIPVQFMPNSKNVAEKPKAVITKKKSVTITTKKVARKMKSSEKLLAAHHERRHTLDVEPKARPKRHAALKTITNLKNIYGSDKSTSSDSDRSYGNGSDSDVLNFSVNAAIEISSSDEEATKENRKEYKKKTIIGRSGPDTSSLSYILPTMKPTGKSKRKLYTPQYYEAVD